MMLPIEESRKRVRRVQELLDAKGLDCALVYYDELSIANGWYLSGWCPQFESGLLLVPKTGEAMVLGGPESEPFARSDSAIRETRNIPVFMVPEEEYPNARISSFAEVFKEVGSKGGVSSIGIVGMGRMPLAIYQDIQAQLTGKKLVDITTEFEAFRRIKSPFELDQITRAFELGDAAFAAVPKPLTPGMTEYELAATVDHAGRRLGANWFGFKTIVAARERANGCVPTPTERKLSAGELVLFGCSFRYNGYACAVGDTLTVGGEPTAAQRQVLSDLAEAFTLTRDMLRVGKTGREIDAPARKFFKEKGYLDYLICPFAHTIGLNEAEAPFFGPHSSDVLKENMAVCIDVSFFNHPEFYGVRVETGYRITAGGPVPFSPTMEKAILSHVRK
jgi:Xaa-Pro aminopeptidase